MFDFLYTFVCCRYLGQDEDVQMREKFEEMDLDMEDVMERMDNANGKLHVLDSNHDMIKKKLSKMASIITGMALLIFYICLRSRPVDPDVVCLSVSQSVCSNVEKSELMTE